MESNKENQNVILQPLLLPMQKQLTQYVALGADPDDNTVHLDQHYICQHLNVLLFRCNLWLHLCVHPERQGEGNV